MWWSPQSGTGGLCYQPSGFRRPRTIQVSTTMVRLNSTSNPPSATAEGAGVMADLASRAGPACGVRARRRPAWSISPAAVAKEPATAGCRLARRSRSGSLPECHRVGRGSTWRARMAGRGTATSGKWDWLLWSESFMPSIKPPEGESCNCHCRPTLGEPPTKPRGQADRVPDLPHPLLRFPGRVPVRGGPRGRPCPVTGGPSGSRGATARVVRRSRRGPSGPGARIRSVGPTSFLRNQRVTCTCR